MTQGRRAASSATAAALKQVILARGLRPGDPMPTEAELSDELGVSRSSVREAVRTLVALDILTVRHGTGTFVGGLSMRPLVEAMAFRGVLQHEADSELLSDIVEVRMGLDFALAPRVVGHLSAASVVALGECVAEINRCAEVGESFAAQDRRFHLLLAEELGNAVYAQLVAAFWDIHMTITPGFGEVRWHSVKATAEAHEAMYEAAVRGDLEAYRLAVGQHYDPLLELLAERRTSPTPERT